MQCGVLLKKQLRANIFDYPKAEMLHNLRFVCRQHVETMRRSFQVHAINRNDFDGIACRRIVAVEIPNGEDGILARGQELNYGGIRKSIAPICEIAVDFKNNVWRFGRWT